MNKISRGLLAFSLLAVASATASATTITGVITVTGTVPNFATPPNPNSSSTSAAQFNASAVNAAIQLGCPSGMVCSALSLTAIDFTLTANLSGALDIVNSNGTTQSIGALPGMGGTNGNPTSGVAGQGTASMSLYDPLANALVVVVPTFNIATNTQIGSGASRQRVLNVAPGTTHFTGTGSDTKYGQYALANCPDTTENGCLDGTVLSAYVGTGNVSFGLGLNGSSVLGSTPNGVTTSNNIATITGGSLSIDYSYSYEVTDAPSGVPEPSTMALFGSAVLAAGVFGRRFKK